ncbi:unnamed protein product [Brugia timori]|uniref:Transposase n=1 Tax=Brugia timori TaxID=42155 RepID=A0A0R3R0Y6_9BILA|nr:unnamed protein product [Brugia timori]
MTSVGSPTSKLPSDPVASIITGTDLVIPLRNLSSFDPGVIKSALACSND